MSRIAPTSNNVSPDISFEIASTADDRNAAFRLVYQSYLRAGLIEPNDIRMRVTPYHLLPTTTVFVAKLRKQQVVTTLSLVIDGELGVPMESTCPGVIEQRRRQGLVVGEVTCLADRRSDIRRFLPNFCMLTRLMAQYARRQGVDQLLVITHPRHARFYSRLMGFEVTTDVTSCPHVRDNPAVALCLDFAKVDRHPPKLYDAIFGEQLPTDELQSTPMTEDERENLEPLVDPSFQHMTLAIA